MDFLYFVDIKTVDKVRRARGGWSLIFTDFYGLKKELMSYMKEDVIPQIVLTEEAKMIVNDAVDNINRELEFMDSYYTSLDSILTLQDLSLIHRVERLLLILAVTTLLMDSLAIILLEIVFK